MVGAMPCPRDGAPLASIALGVETIERCTHCRGVWTRRAGLEALVGAPVVSRPAGLAIAGVGAAAASCPTCGRHLEEEETREAPGKELLVCRDCARVFVDEDTLGVLRASRGRLDVGRAREHERATQTRERDDHEESASTTSPSAEGNSRDHDLERSVFSPGPMRELAVLAGTALLAWLFVQSMFGEAVAFFVRIQFHELGHALVAWCTGRSALPLPFGWTSWSFERSSILVAMELLFAVLLATWGVREKKPMAVVVAIAMGCVFTLGLATPLEGSEPWLVAGGMIGEALLPAIALLVFHVPLPSRVRWDFFRWPLAMLAILAVVSVGPHFLSIASGDAPLPMGSFVSGREGDGDLERLIADYAWPRASLQPFFGRLGLLTLLIGLLPHPIVLGARALVSRRRG